MIHTPDTSLIRSAATESLADLLGNVSETLIDSVIESGALRDIPIIGLFTGALKASGDIRSAIFLRKITVFLKELSETSAEDRKKFVDKFDSEEGRHEFGQAILMLLDRAEDLIKPRLIARIISAYIQKNIDYPKAMRLCAIIGRCYSQDLFLLQSFTNGTQGEFTPIAESLQSAGLLSNGGFDGGTLDGDDGGVLYVMNEYGHLLKQYALCVG
jgi:hypothetical protein